MNEIRRWLQSLIDIVRDRIAVYQLQQEINRIKLENYDLIVENMRGLRRVIETQKRAIADLHGQLEARNSQISKLQIEYTGLQARLADGGQASSMAERAAILKKLAPMLAQAPTLRASLAEGARLKASDVVDLFAPLDDILRDLGVEQIGEAGSEVRYDPARHRPVGRGSRAVTADSVVRVRYVGYMLNGQIICKAEVTPVEQPEPVS